MCLPCDYYCVCVCVVVLSLRPVGNTPTLKNKKFAVEKSRDICMAVTMAEDKAQVFRE